MLADLLPGLRELRAPLAAGYLWLLLGWLIAGDDIAAAGGVVKRLTDLGGGVNDAAVAVAASFAAYLLGSLSEDLFGRVLERTVRELSWERAQPGEHPDDMSLALIESQIARLENRAGRLQAESSLRVSILPPLAAVLVYFAVVDSWLWAFTLIVLPALAAQAYLRTADFLSASGALYELRQRLGLPPSSVREESERAEAKDAQAEPD